MKTILKLSILLLASALAGFSQNTLWSLPDKYVKNGIPLSLPTGDYTGAAAQFAHNAMHDAQGNLLFFVVDGRIYNAQGQILDEMKVPGTSTILAGGHEFSIVPVPGSCRRYFIFGAHRGDASGYFEYPYYAVFDLDSIGSYNRSSQHNFPFLPFSTLIR